MSEAPQWVKVMAIMFAVQGFMAGLATSPADALLWAVINFGLAYGIGSLIAGRS